MHMCVCVIYNRNVATCTNQPANVVKFNWHMAYWLWKQLLELLHRIPVQKISAGRDRELYIYKASTQLVPKNMIIYEQITVAYK